jgi:hypothetical protein
MEKNGENGSGPASLGAETDVDQHPDSLGSRIGQNSDLIKFRDAGFRVDQHSALKNRSQVLHRL